MKKLFAILLAVAMVISLCGCDSADYKKASETMASGDYAAAREAFLALGDYEDSAEKVKECDYQLAKVLFESADYAAAVTAFEALAGYEDSADYTAKATEELLRAAVVGRWTCADVDMTEEFMEVLITSLGEEVAVLDYCELPPMLLSMDMEVFEKGTFTVTLDSDRFMESMNGLIDALKAGLKNYFVSELEAALAEGGLTLEDAYNELGVSNDDELLTVALGVSLDELFDMMGLTDTLSSLVDNSATSGVWEVEGETLTLTVGDVQEKGVYDAAADTITVTEGTGVGPYPQVYERK